MAQCRSCQFHNMPGAAQCGRCGASLLLSTAAINVHPPRASKWAKTWRRTSMSRLVRSLRSQSIMAAKQIGFEPEASLPSLGILLRMIVPGWPQLYSGNSVLGGRLLAAYLFCGFLAAMFIGTILSSLAIAACLTIHAISVYEIGYRSTKSQGGRLSRTLLGCGLLGVCLYVPLYSRLIDIAAPIQIQLNRAPLERGEVLIVNRTAFQSAPPRIGDLVVYDVAELRAAGLTPQGGNAIYVLGGERIDRILAGPNQTVHWEGATLTVDGVESNSMPLNPGGMPIKVDLTVPADHYLIFPSTEVFNFGFVNDESRLRQLIMIPRRNILGRIYWRSSPLRRMGPL